MRREESTIAELWSERALEVYPENSRAFLSSHQDAFDNPVGQGLVQGTKAILRGLIGNTNPKDLRSHLVEIIRIRAVQDISPGLALSFLFVLKQVIREILNEALEDPKIKVELEVLYSRIDALVLEAFDIYVECKKEIFEIRVRETKRTVSGFLKRTGFF